MNTELKFALGATVIILAVIVILGLVSALH